MFCVEQRILAEIDQHASHSMNQQCPRNGILLSLFAYLSERRSTQGSETTNTNFGESIMYSLLRLFYGRSDRKDENPENSRTQSISLEQQRASVRTGRTLIDRFLCSSLGSSSYALTAEKILVSVPVITKTRLTSAFK